MAIIIPHRFIQRISSAADYDKINLIIIGTFNPGHPLADALTAYEMSEFNQIRNSNKFKKIDQVKNFYDRSQNRFWKIMDFLNDRAFYDLNAVKEKNINGLKHYKKMDRDLVYNKQTGFCKKHGIFITDIVRTIHPVSFQNIYNNFPDSVIEKSNPVWNTDDIIHLLHNHHPKFVLINFKTDGKTIPKITGQISLIMNKFPEIHFVSLKSTSGAAGNTYEELIKNWKGYFEWIS